MSAMRTAIDTLNADFLEVRARLLEIGATLDRIERAGGGVDDDPRMVGIRRAIDALSVPGQDRAREIQMIFSRAYDPDWRRAYGLDDGKAGH